MSDSSRGSDRLGRRAKRFLTPLQKYQIWLQLVRQETTIGEAADQWAVDRSTIMRLREVAKQGALAAVARSRRGWMRPPRPACWTWSSRRWRPAGRFVRPAGCWSLAWWVPIGSATAGWGRCSSNVPGPRPAVAVGHSILVIAWQLLTDDCDDQDLGGDDVVRRDTDRQRQRDVAQLQALGYGVVLEPVAA